MISNAFQTAYTACFATTAPATNMEKPITASVSGGAYEVRDMWNICKGILFPILLLFAHGASSARDISTIDQLCQKYVGQVMGVRDGNQILISCDQIRTAEKSMSAGQTEPHFRGLRNSLKGHVDEDFSKFILNDPDLSQKCAKDRFTLSNKYVCSFLSDGDGKLVFSLDRSNRLEKAEIWINSAALKPLMLNAQARLNISNPSPAMGEIIMHLNAIISRRLSDPDELYSTDGKTFQVQIWPSRLR
jgi:hypothetical protein